MRLTTLLLVSALVAPVALGGCATQTTVEKAQQLGGKTQLRVIQSIFGHDSFLTEPERVGALIREFLDAGR